jgi:hypothetical protein
MDSENIIERMNGKWHDYTCDTKHHNQYSTHAIFSMLVYVKRKNHEWIMDH